MHIKRFSRIILLSSVFLYFLIYFIFYPETYAIFDEACYLDLAYAFREGTIYLDEVGISVPHCPVKSDSHLVSIYPPGNSFFLAPFTFLGIKGIFIYGLIFHLLGFFVFIKILTKFKLAPEHAIFYLFYPPYLLFSRTIMSDIPGAIFFLIGFYLYIKENYLWSGLSFGCSFIIRYVNVVLLPVFIVMVLWRKRWEGLKLLIGILLFLALCLFYNYRAYGGIFATGYGLPLRSLFNIGSIAIKLPVYLGLFFIVYPLMILTLFFYKGSYRVEILVSCATLFLIYSTYTLYGEPTVTILPKIALLSIRFFFPVVPFMLLTYLSVWGKIWGNKRVFLVIWIVLIFFSIGVHWGHARYLSVEKEFRDSVYRNTDVSSLIVCNAEFLELISRAWGERRAILLHETKNLDLDDISSSKDVYLGTLIRRDHPEEAQHILAVRDSILKEKFSMLVERIQSFDKEFELYRLFPKGIPE